MAGLGEDCFGSGQSRRGSADDDSGLWARQEVPFQKWEEGSELREGNLGDLGGGAVRDHHGVSSVCSVEPGS